MRFRGQDTRVRREAVGSDNFLSDVRGAFDDNENAHYWSMKCGLRVRPRRQNSSTSSVWEVRARSIMVEDRGESVHPSELVGLKWQSREAGIGA